MSNSIPTAGIAPVLWGYHFWCAMHSIIFISCPKVTEYMKRELLIGFCATLPCMSCRTALVLFMYTCPIMSDLNTWLYRAHEYVNCKLRKPGLSREDAEEKQAFNQQTAVVDISFMIYILNNHIGPAEISSIHAQHVSNLLQYCNAVFPSYMWPQSVHTKQEADSMLLSICGIAPHIMKSLLAGARSVNR